MNYMPDGTKRSHKQGRLEWMDKEGIMSYDQPSSATASIVQGCGSCESHVSPVTFNIDGQPISDNVASLSTMIGRSMKNNIPPSFDKWSNVPNVMKEKMWDIVNANECWRNWKSKLNRYIYSKYHTEADRKKSVPKFVKKEDWESFIDMCSTYAAQEKSKLGKATRQAMRCPHNSGRKGQVRVADELRRKNPDKEIKRTDVRLETHTKKDGFASCEEADIWIKTRWHGSL
ncbi:hypothetical protein AAC387_Pa05g1963 [Persea americana]